MLGVEGLRRFASPVLRAAKPASPWVCLALGCHAWFLMLVEAFLDYSGDADFIRGVLLLLPFLLAIGPLVRAGACLGVMVSALFHANSLAMLLHNGTSLGGECGFFEVWVS